MEKSIRLTTEEVRAVLDGRKTQIRRPIKFEFLKGFNPEWTGYVPVFENGKFFLEGSKRRTATTEVKCPYGQPGDILWVKETWQNVCAFPLVYAYKADGEFEPNSPWKRSVHMPREAARLFLQVKDVRVERLQDITYDEIVAEGIYCDPPQPEYLYPVGFRIHFAKEWDSLYAERGYGWDLNPFVWVIEFERAEVQK